MPDVPIRTETIDLQQLLKLADIAGTGGEAKMIIGDGLVRVNGEPTSRRRHTVRPGDVVEVDIEGCEPIRVTAADPDR